MVPSDGQSGTYLHTSNLPLYAVAYLSAVSDSHILCFIPVFQKMPTGLALQLYDLPAGTFGVAGTPGISAFRR